MVFWKAGRSLEIHTTREVHNSNWGNNAVLEREGGRQHEDIPATEEVADGRLKGATVDGGTRARETEAGPPDEQTAAVGGGGGGGDRA